MLPQTATTHLPGLLPEATLHRLAAIIHAINHRALRDGEGNLLLASLGPLVDECLQSRRKLALIADVAAPGNVTLFPGVR